MTERIADVIRKCGLNELSGQDPLLPTPPPPTPLKPEDDKESHIPRDEPSSSHSLTTCNDVDMRIEGVSLATRSLPLSSGGVLDGAPVAEKEIDGNQLDTAHADEDLRDCARCVSLSVK